MRKPANPSGRNSANGGNNGGAKLRKGLWSPEEDDKLMSYMLTNGQGCWSDVARNAGLLRCGKSCRLRWINYLRPDLKRGAFSPKKKRSSSICIPLLATARLPGRTDNEIKNFWNSTIKKRLKNSSSPNASDSSSVDRRDFRGAGGTMSTWEQGIMATMYTNSSSSSASSFPSIPSMALTQMMNPLPIADSQSLDVPSAACEWLNHTSSCMLTQVDIDACDGLPYGNYGVMFGDYDHENIGLQGELSVPPLDSVSIEDNAKSENIFARNPNNNSSNHLDNNQFNSINTAIYNCINSDKVEINSAFGNNWKVDDIKLEEYHWDLEELIGDVSSLPFLDYQVE